MTMTEQVDVLRRLIVRYENWLEERDCEISKLKDRIAELEGRKQKNGTLLKFIPGGRMGGGQ